MIVAELIARQYFNNLRPEVYNERVNIARARPPTTAQGQTPPLSKSYHECACLCVCGSLYLCVCVRDRAVVFMFLYGSYVRVGGQAD